MLAGYWISVEQYYLTPVPCKGALNHNKVCWEVVVAKKIGRSVEVIITTSVKHSILLIITFFFHASLGAQDYPLDST